MCFSIPSCHLLIFKVPLCYSSSKINKSTGVPDLDKEHEDGINVAESCSRLHVEAELLLEIPTKSYTPHESIDERANQSDLILQR